MVCPNPDDEAGGVGIGPQQLDGAAAAVGCHQAPESHPAYSQTFNLFDFLLQKTVDHIVELLSCRMPYEP
jgi:hypothetical protein